jgi:hypothetical protein
MRHRLACSTVGACSLLVVALVFAGAGKAAASIQFSASSNVGVYRSVADAQPGPYRAVLSVTTAGTTDVAASSAAIPSMVEVPLGFSWVFSDGISADLFRLIRPPNTATSHGQLIDMLSLTTNSVGISLCSPLDGFEARISGSGGGRDVQFRMTVTEADGTVSSRVFRSLPQENGLSLDGFFAADSPSGLQSVTLERVEGQAVDPSFSAPEPASLVVWLILAALGAGIGRWRRRKAV